MPDSANLSLFVLYQIEITEKIRREISLFRRELTAWLAPAKVLNLEVNSDKLGRGRNAIEKRSALNNDNTLLIIEYIDRLRWIDPSFPLTPASPLSETPITIYGHGSIHFAQSKKKGNANRKHC